MATATFRFHGSLSPFLARERRERAFEHSCARAASLKNAIEALGVPHTEAGRLTVNGAPATLDRIVRDEDWIEVWPWNGAPEVERLAFLADAHLGGLARFLRMLGYDTLHEPDIADAAIRSLAWRERRIVLTRDRELLKCRDIARGCYVRALKAEAQVREVAARFDLGRRAQPFTLCLMCNARLRAVDREAVAARLPPTVAAVHRRFTHCARCDRVYWEGSHYDRMRAALGRALVQTPDQSL